MHSGTPILICHLMYSFTNQILQSTKYINVINIKKQCRERTNVLSKGPGNQLSQERERSLPRRRNFFLSSLLKPEKCCVQNCVLRIPTEILTPNVSVTEYGF